MTKKKKSTALRDSLGVIGTIIFLLICTTGTYYSIKMFFKSLNASLTKMNETPIATITFKHKTAQRKFEERMVWDRLAQHSPVYDGDTIRTAPESEATIFFEDGNIMDLDENTMAQIFLHEGKMQANVEEGTVVVNTTDAANGAVVVFGNSKIELNSGASVKTSFSKESGAQINVMQGNAVFTNQNGLTKAIEEGNAISLNEKNEEQIVPLITVTMPNPNKKVLNFTGNAYMIDFKWNVQNLSRDDFLVLEISSDKKFKNIIQREEFKNQNQEKIGLQSGLYFWRIFPAKAGEQYSAQSKINILDVPQPELIVPEAAAEYSYKAVVPDVRFSWTQNDWVTAFDFEVADNPRMEKPVEKQRITTASSIVSSLNEGVWYWRVTPYYAMNGIGFAAPSEIRSFRISKKATLGVPELILPAADEIVNTVQKQEIQFSWKNNPEIVEYEIKISKDKNCRNPIITEKVKTNFFSLNAEDNAMKKGEWYWCVTQRDNDGEISKQSEIRKFSTDEILFEQRLIYPPENFTTLDSNVEGLRFTWRSSIPGDNVFQVARDEEFADIVFEQVANKGYFQGTELLGGNYFWRVSSKDKPEQFSTKGRALHILSPLVTPSLIFPSNGYRIALSENSKSEFRWNAVPGADFYVLRLYNPEQPDKILYTKNVEGTKETISFDELTEGVYSWTVQAVAEKTNFSSQRLSGFMSRNFNLRKSVAKTAETKKPVLPKVVKNTLATPELVEPEDKMIFGMAQIKNSKSIKFSWSPVKGANQYIFTLKNAGGKTVMEQTLEQTEFVLEKIVDLGNGRFTWSVQAFEKSEKGAALQRSKAATRTFSINLPVVEEIILNDTGILYGM